MNAGRTWTRQRVAAFRDRTDESRRIAEHVAHVIAVPDHLAVFEVVGIGGVGKSRFLAEVATTARADLGALPISVSLSLEAALTAAAPLLAIRNQLPVDCWLFDTALLSYWAATDQPGQPIGRTPEDSLAGQMAQAADALPRTFAAEVFAALPRDRSRSRGYSATMFAEVDALRSRPDELHARLPSYLGRDMRRRRRNPEMGGLLVLYDAYDKQSAGTLAARARWLRDLIGSVGAGVHLIAAREPLSWGTGPWGPIERVRLGPLPEVECRRLIRRELGELSRSVEDRLISTSGGVAFYLHASIDVCRVHIDENGAVRAGELPSTQPEAVEHLLGHLAPAERRLAVVLATVQYFDRPLYGHLVRTLDLSGRVVGIDDFVEWFFVADVGGGIYRTHDLLTEAVRTSEERRGLEEQALHQATVHLAGRRGLFELAEIERRLRLFHALVEAWQSLPSVPVPAAERLVDIGYELYDAGYWDETGSLPMLATAPPMHAAMLTARLFRALTLRRREGPNRALAELEPLAPHITVLGRHSTSFEIEVAYLREISGDYARARQEFRELSARSVPFDPSDRAHVRARLYHADMLTMDGHFEEASRLLFETYDAVGVADAVGWAELVRHRGHALRFSFEFDEAERRYFEALDASADAPGMIAKLRTNLAETLCWTDPVHALGAADLAADLNTRLGSTIELAKIEAARAVALAGLDRLSEGRDACDLALEQARAVGYPAGQCFAHQARVVVAARASEPEEADAAYRDLVAGVESLGTYGHLCVIPAWLRRDEREVARWSEGVGWTAPPDLDACLARLAGR